MAYDQFSYVNLYAPFLLEDELTSLSDKPSKIMDFRVKNELSETIVRQACSYIFDGMPLTRLSINSGDSLAKVYNNKVLTKEIPVNPRTGRIVPHDTYNPAFYHGIYSEIIVENSYQLSKDEQLAVYCTAINSIYVKVRNNQIIGLSPLLEHQIDIWKLSNNKSTYTNKDLFGTDSIRGEIVSFGNPTLSTSTISSLNRTYTNIDVPGGTAYGGYSSGYTEYVALYPVDANIVSPKIGIHFNNFGLQVRKEGGSSSKTTVSNTNDSTIKVTSRTATGPLRGTAKPNWTVYVNFPGDISRGVPVDGRGYWYCDYPTSPYTAEELGSITVSQQETQNTSVSTENNTPAIVQRTYGLPILEFEKFPNGVNSYNFYSNTVKSIGQLDTSGINLSHGGECFRHIFTSTSTDYRLTGVYVGRPTTDYFHINDKFISWPGSIVQETGVDVFLYYAKEALGTVSVTPIDLVAKSSPVVSVSVGSQDYLNNTQTLGTTWLSENLNNFRDRLKVVYEANYDPIVSQLKVRWEKNAEVQNFSRRFKTSWESEPVNWMSEDLTIRYEVTLPEDRIVRDFLTCSWDKELTQSFSNITKTTWEKEKTFFITKELETSWDTVLVDTVILKPFFIQLWDPVKRTYTDSMSFNVYGDSEKMAQYIANGELRYLFSNPPKFELVMFDYNLYPYSDVFLTQLQDPILDRDFSDVPDRFSKIGNYTIKDINRYNSLSLDVIGVDKQLNEYKSYWIPEVIEDYAGSFLTMKDGKSKLLILDNMFKDDHHEDVVELDLIILDGEECCFTQSSTGSRCSPY